MRWLDQENEKVEGLKLKGGTPPFTAERKLTARDTSGVVGYMLKIDGGQFKVKDTVEFGGERDFDIEAKRRKDEK